MTLIPTIINNRQIHYLNISENLDSLNLMTLKNWVLFVIEDDSSNPILSSFASLCIEKDVAYVCSAGKACSEIDDLFDMEMVIRKIYKKYIPNWIKSDDDILMTTWHYDFDEGFWFVSTQTELDNIDITDIVVVNLTKNNYQQRIELLSKRISEGWVPPN
jgi:hypothetical protein